MKRRINNLLLVGGSFNHKNQVEDVCHLHVTLNRHVDGFAHGE